MGPWDTGLRTQLLDADVKKQIHAGQVRVAVLDYSSKAASRHHVLRSFIKMELHSKHRRLS